MKSSIAAVPLMLLLSLILTSCGGRNNPVTSIFETDPAGPSEADVARVLCARDDLGRLIFGPIKLSRADTPETIKFEVARTDAWNAATKDGALCSHSSATP